MGDCLCIQIVQDFIRYITIEDLNEYLSGHFFGETRRMLQDTEQLTIFGDVHDVVATSRWSVVVFLVEPTDVDMRNSDHRFVVELHQFGCLSQNETSWRNKSSFLELLTIYRFIILIATSLSLDVSFANLTLDKRKT